MKPGELGGLADPDLRRRRGGPRADSKDSKVRLLRRGSRPVRLVQPSGLRYTAGDLADLSRLCSRMGVGSVSALVTALAEFHYNAYGRPLGWPERAAKTDPEG